jgi:hypothetical protein
MEPLSWTNAGEVFTFGPDLAVWQLIWGLPTG